MPPQGLVQPWGTEQGIGAVCEGLAAVPTGSSLCSPSGEH